MQLDAVQMSVCEVEAIAPDLHHTGGGRIRIGTPITVAAYGVNGGLLRQGEKVT